MTEPGDLLNRKLAEGTGFKLVEEAHHANIWEFPDGTTHEGQPNFVLSLDACFKHLAPKAIEKIKAKHNRSSSRKLGDSDAYMILFGLWLDEGFDAPALCKAIEKILEGEVGR